MALHKTNALLGSMGLHVPLGDHTQTHGVDLVRADTIPPANIRWLWPGFLAKGKLTILAGPPATGKTGLAMAIAAIVSAGGALGRTWPDGASVEPGDVVIWSGEDGVEDTLIPRLSANGAAMWRVHVVRGTRDAGRMRGFNFATDLPALDQALHGLNSVSLIVIDSLAQAMTGDTNSNRAVRRGLEALLEVAARHDCALLGLTHVNKGSQKREPLERVTGSLAFGAVPRVVLLTARSKAVDGDACPANVLVRCKSNVGEDGGGFEYWTDSAQVYGEGGETVATSRIRWGDRPLHGSAAEILRSIDTPGLDAKSSVVDRATEFLTRVLSQGPMPYPNLVTLAKTEGISEASIKRARAARQPAIRHQKMQGAGPASPFIWSLEGGAGSPPGWPPAPLAGEALPHAAALHQPFPQGPLMSWRPHAQLPGSVAPYGSPPFAPPHFDSSFPSQFAAPHEWLAPVAPIAPIAPVGHVEQVESHVQAQNAEPRLPARGSATWATLVEDCVFQCKDLFKRHAWASDDDPLDVATDICHDITDGLNLGSVPEEEEDQFLRALRRDVDQTNWWLDVMEGAAPAVATTARRV